MSRISLAFILTFASAFAFTDENHPIDIYSKNVGTRHDIGILGTVTPTPWLCGTENGNFLSMEVTGCTNQACMMSAGYWYEVAPVFSPKTNINSLMYHANFYPYPRTSEYIRLSVVPVPGSFTAGRTYRVFGEFEIPESIRGKKGMIAVGLSDNTPAWHVHRCFETTISN